MLRALRNKSQSFLFKIFLVLIVIGFAAWGVGDLTGNKIPFISENSSMKKALDIITKKKLGVLIVRDSKKNTTGIITDGQIRRSNLKKGNLRDLKVKNIMTKNPISIDKDVLAAKSLAIMSDKKITSLCVHKNPSRNKTIGILHIHHILNANIQ